MNPTIGAEVYIEIQKNSYSHGYGYGYNGNNGEWEKGKVVAEFVGGDLLVEYGNDKIERCNGANVAFTDEDMLAAIRIPGGKEDGIDLQPSNCKPIAGSLRRKK